MDIGIPKQKHPFDYRVGLTPMGVEMLAQLGHRCYVEAGAGQGSGFDDERYRRAGATVVYSAAEVYGRGQMILMVSRPPADEIEMLQEGQILCGFLHLAVVHPSKLEFLLKHRITAIAYETVQSDDGFVLIRAPIGQIAGRMLPPRGGPVAAEQRGRARHSTGRRARGSGGQSGHPRRGHRRRERGYGLPGRRRGCRCAGHGPPKATDAGGARFRRADHGGLRIQRGKGGARR